MINKNDIIIQVEGNGDGFGTIWREKTPQEKAISKAQSFGKDSPKKMRQATDLLGPILDKLY